MRHGSTRGLDTRVDQKLEGGGPFRSRRSARINKRETVDASANGLGIPREASLERNTPRTAIHKKGFRVLGYYRERAQSNNDASNVAMAPSRRDTAKDYFSPRMAVDTTPQDHAADAPRVD